MFWAAGITKYYLLTVLEYSPVQASGEPGSRIVLPRESHAWNERRQCTSCSRAWRSRRPGEIKTSREELREGRQTIAILGGRKSRGRKINVTTINPLLLCPGQERRETSGGDSFRLEVSFGQEGDPMCRIWRRTGHQASRALRLLLLIELYYFDLQNCS